MPNEIPESTAGGTGNAASPTGTQQIDWQAQSAEWQTRFTGLQGKYQQEQAKWKADSAKLFDLEQAQVKLSGERDAISAQLVTLQDELGLAKTETELVKVTEARLRTVVKDFPELIAFELQGLLPDAEGEELTAKLTAFKTSLEQIGKSAVQQVASAATPPPPAPAGQRTAKQALLEATAAIKDGDMGKYETLYTEFVQLSGKE